MKQKTLDILFELWTFGVEEFGLEEDFAYQLALKYLECRGYT